MQGVVGVQRKMNYILAAALLAIALFFMVAMDRRVR